MLIFPMLTVDLSINGNGALFSTSLRIKKHTRTYTHTHTHTHIYIYIYIYIKDIVKYIILIVL